jgi:hypothetical protein
MPRYEVFRIIGTKPGCVDFLGDFDGASEQEVEDVCRLMFDFDWAGGDYIDVQEVDHVEVTKKTNGME